MFKKRFQTAIDGKHKLGSNDFVLGRIMGIMHIMCDGQISGNFALKRNEELDLWILTTECTRRRYNAFVDRIEEEYPGLCVFDYAS